MPTVPVYTLGVELTPNSLTELTSLVARAYFRRSSADAFRTLRADEGVFELFNDQGSLSPLRNSGLAHGRRVRLSATYGGSSFNLFSGRLKRVTTKPGLAERTTVLEALTDADRMSRLQITTGILQNIQLNSLVAEIGTRSQLQSYSADGNCEIANFAWYQDRVALNALNELTLNQGYVTYFDGAGTLRVRSPFTAAYASPVGSYSMEANEAFDFNSKSDAETVYNSTRVSFVARAQTSDVRTVGYLASPITGPQSGNPLTFFVNFIDPRDGLTSVPVGSLVTPVASQDYYFSASSDGTGTNLTPAITVSLTQFGASALVTCTSSSGTSGWAHRFQLRGYPILSGAPLSRKFENSSSQNVYGRRELSLEDSLIVGEAIAAIGMQRLEERKEPILEAGLTLANEFPQVLQYDICDKLHLSDSFTGVNSMWEVRGMTHELDLSAGLRHSVSYELEKVQPPIHRLLPGWASMFPDGPSNWAGHGNPNFLTSAPGRVGFLYPSSFKGVEIFILGDDLTAGDATFTIYFRTPTSLDTSFFQSVRINSLVFSTSSLQSITHQRLLANSDQVAAFKWHTGSSGLVNWITTSYAVTFTP